MKLGILTVPFEGRSLLEIADWAQTEGFSALEVPVWPTRQQSDRRYAGVTHIDVESITAESAKQIVRDLHERGVVISALGYYPNPLDPDEGRALAAREHLRKVFRAASLLDVNLVNTFAGADKTKPVDANLMEFERVFPALVHEAGDLGVHVAIENCPMIFSGDEWPGGNNLAYSPAVWRRMFEMIPDENFGINFDPSHLIWQMIDVPRAIKELGSRVKHVHCKDLEIDRDRLYENGVMSGGIGWQIPRICGLGQVEWGPFFGALYAIGYDGAAIIEHEDRAFEGTLQAVERGFLIARDNLAPYVR